MCGCVWWIQAKHLQPTLPELAQFFLHSTNFLLLPGRHSAIIKTNHHLALELGSCLLINVQKISFKKYCMSIWHKPTFAEDFSVCISRITEKRSNCTSNRLYYSTRRWEAEQFVGLFRFHFESPWAYLLVVATEGWRKRSESQGVVYIFSCECVRHTQSCLLFKETSHPQWWAVRASRAFSAGPV